MYATAFGSDFGQFVPNFVSDVWFLRIRTCVLCLVCLSFPFCKVFCAQLPKRHHVAIAATGENVWYMYIPRSTAISGMLVYGIIALLVMPFI